METETANASETFASCFPFSPYILNLFILIDIIIATSARGTGSQLCPLPPTTCPDSPGLSLSPFSRLLSLTSKPRGHSWPSEVQEEPVLKQGEACAPVLLGTCGNGVGDAPRN